MSMDSLTYLKAIQKHFLSANDLCLLNWDELLKALVEVSHEVCQDLQNELLKLTVKDLLVVRYPMKLSYQQNFLKKLISQLEEKGVEVSDDIYSCYLQLLQQKTNDNESYFRHFMLPNNKYITLCERKSFISEGTTGLCTWQGSFALCEWIIRNKNEFQDKTILELGSGTGLAGLTILKCCNINTYHFSDCHTEVLKQLHHNVVLNRNIPVKIIDDKFTYDKNTKSSIYYCTKYDDCDVNILNLSWECIHEYDLSDVKPPDIMIASDIVYDGSLFDPLCNTLEYFLKEREIYFLLVCTIRNNETFQTFLETIAARNLCVKELPPVESKYMPFSSETPITFLKIYYSKTIGPDKAS